MELDFLVFAAHPDDAELSMGGTIAKQIKNGNTFGIVDLTKGELGTRGNINTRAEESASASKILNISIRENLGIPDGKIVENDDNINKIITTIRKYRPTIIFAPYFNDRHPDHIDASMLIKRAYFLSGLTKIKTVFEGSEQEAYRPKKIFYFAQTFEFTPTFIIDISDTFEIKMDAMRAYKTQFYMEGEKSSEPETFISTPDFFDSIIARAKSYGFKIGKKYGEPFYSEEFIEVDLSNMLEGIK